MFVHVWTFDLALVLFILADILVLVLVLVNICLDANAVSERKKINLFGTIDFALNLPQHLDFSLQISFSFG